MPRLVQVDQVETVVEAYKPAWREKTVVFRLPSGRVLALDGWQYGTLVVHATWGVSTVRGIQGVTVGVEGVRPFTVTHLPSLLSLCRVAEVDDAIAKAEWLWQQCPRAWSGDEVDRASIPAGVLQWCEENKR